MQYGKGITTGLILEPAYGQTLLEEPIEKNGTSEQKENVFQYFFRVRPSGLHLCILFTQENFYKRLGSDCSHMHPTGPV